MKSRARVGIRIPYGGRPGASIDAHFRGGRVQSCRPLSADRPAALADLEPVRCVRLSVLDTGIGIDSAIRDRIFDPFFTTKEVGKGTGMGLAMACGIVRDHQGVIDVGSLPGSGTEFRIYLPAAEDPEAR